VFIGDVHGCAEELELLLEEIRFDPAVHDLWLTGDLVNRGPESLRALRRVREIAAGAVLGNHDLHLLRVAAGERDLHRRDTFTDILEAPDRDELLDWLRRRPLAVGWPDLLLVHAGLDPRWKDPEATARPLEEAIAAGRIPTGSDDLAFFTLVRYCDAEGHASWENDEPPPGLAPWDEHYSGERLVVFGHWAARGRVRTDRVRGLDTACVWGGALTAWIAEEDRFVSVPSRRVYQAPRR